MFEVEKETLSFFVLFCSVKWSFFGKVNTRNGFFEVVGYFCCYNNTMCHRREMAAISATV